MDATTLTSRPYWLEYPPAIQLPSAAEWGLPRIRTNMKPDVMTSEVTIVVNAHVQRFIRAGPR
jgi:hypothetical protein